jgi:hypothetical protein
MDHVAHTAHPGFLSISLRLERRMDDTPETITTRR